MGHFEFRLCPNNNPAKPATQACLDRFATISRRANNEPTFVQVSFGAEQRSWSELLSRTWQPSLWNTIPGCEDFDSKLIFSFQLPKDLTCAQCVFQWRYIAANNWGELSFLLSYGFLLRAFVFVFNFFYFCWLCVPVVSRSGSISALVWIVFVQPCLLLFV